MIPDNKTELLNEDETAQDLADSGSALEESLRHLRLRNLNSNWNLFNTANVFETTNDDEIEPIESNEESVVQSVQIEDILIEEHEQDPNYNEEDYAFADALNALSEEVRRMGREIFRSNRANERNQEMTDDAIEEIRRLESTVAKIPAQHNDVIAEAKFHAKAELCRELLRLNDTLSIELASIDELISLQEQIVIKNDNFLHRLLTFSRSIDMFSEVLKALNQWRVGRLLHAERLGNILYTAGIREIETKKFSPQLHRAVSAIDAPDFSPGTIIKVESKGYTLDGRILRYAEVVTSK